MTTTNDDLDQLLGGTPGDGQTPTEGSKLRQQLESALSKLAERDAALAKLTEKDRARDVEALFTKHSIPPLAKDFFPTDAELTDESATAFVEKYGQLWGATAAEANATPEQQAQAAAVQALTATGTPPPAGLLTEEGARAKFAEAKTAEDIMRLTAEAVQGYSVVME
jgi:hypothetical protein